MKKIAIVIVGLSLIGSVTTAGAGPTEGALSFSGLYTLPGLGDLDLYDWGAGAEMQVHFWLSEHMGWAGAMGWSQWEASSSSTQWGAPVDGATQMIPLGASLLYRTSSEPGVRWLVEGGLRYVVVSTDLALEVSGEEKPVSLDDGVVAVLAADIERDVSFGQIFAGVAFQIDLMAPEASWSGGELRDSDLAAVLFRVGLRRMF
jgi:hypothetical protein